MDSIQRDGQERKRTKDRGLGTSLTMKIIFIVFLVLLGGANAFSQKKIGSNLASTQATMFPNKDYHARTYKKIIVFTGLVDGDTDLKALKEFSSVGLTVVSGLELFPPSKKYSEE